MKEARSFRSIALGIGISFFLGALIGFPLEIRSQLPSEYIVVSPPAILSLWGMWEIPGALLLGAMLPQVLRSLVTEERRGVRNWKILKSILVLLLACTLVVWGTIPLPTINGNNPWSWIDSLIVGGTLVTPLVVGLTTSFATGQRTNMGVFTSSAAWLGAASVLILFTIIGAQTTNYVESNAHLWIPRHPEDALLLTAVIWVPGGLLLSALGGLIGRWLLRTLENESVPGKLLLGREKL